MTLSIEAVVEHLSGGILLAIKFQMYAIVLVLIFKFTIRKLLLWIGGKFVSSREVIISMGNLNGVDLGQFSKDYSGQQLVEILEALLSGVDPKVFKERIYSVQEIRDVVKDFKNKDNTVIEEEDIEVIYPSINDLAELGIDSSNYLDVDQCGIPHVIEGKLAKVPSGAEDVIYQVLNVKEGLLLYRVGAVTLLKRHD